jgi:hypothetical protein
VLVIRLLLNRAMLHCQPVCQLRAQLSERDSGGTGHDPAYYPSIAPFAFEQIYGAWCDPAATAKAMDASHSQGLREIEQWHAHNFARSALGVRFVLASLSGFVCLTNAST